ncbi:GFA family protein [Pacificoceanicola onchidii]|uniref:GFA family protein n=1 Tax=Pacificoceanicola onchidii TaxID=2562685 RepID=UPI0014561FC7|nr:GFA family protein [Pacificoceanicola onchidii]
MPPKLSGRCLCGAVRYKTTAAPLWTALCHCESCRRACSAPVVAWMGFAPSDVKWEGTRKTYQSSEIATRGFCETCGTQISFESTRWPGEIHLYAVSLDDPADYQPQLHCHAAERLPWLHMADDLPVFKAGADLS